MRLLLLAALFVLPALSLAQTAPDRAPVPAYEVMKAPAIDGKIEEAEWAGVPSFEGLVDEQTGTPAPDGGRFWLGYDARFVYFAARLEDRQPRSIQATEYRTNVGLSGNDTVSLHLDPFGNLSDFNSFTINPRGATSLDIAGGRAAKREWLGDILAAGRVTDTGWEVEARIPWSVMRLPGQGVRDLRFNVSRYMPRVGREYTWAFTQAGREQNTGRWLGVRVPQAAPATLKLLPYAYGGWDGDQGLVANSGLDFRYPLSDRLDLVGTINPDFRNVENQVLSLDFSYFERLAGETRPFFLEGSEYFRTSSDAPIFASQRIRTMDVGAKAFGKLDDKTDVGVLGVFGVERQNAAVARVRRQFTPRSSAFFSYVGLASPAQGEEPARDNHTVFGQYEQGWGPYFTFGSLSVSHDRHEDTGHRINTGLYYGKSGLDWGAEYVEITPHFRPRLGFVPERDLRGVTGFLGYTRPTKQGRIIEYAYSFFGSYYLTYNGGPYRRSIGIDGSVTLVDGTDLDIGASYQGFRDFDAKADEGSQEEPGGGADAGPFVRDYHDWTVYVGLERPRGDPYRHWDVNYEFGKRAGEAYQNLGFGFAYRPVPLLQLSGSHQVVLKEGKVEAQSILSATYDLGRDQSISGRLVQGSDISNAYLAYRKSGNRGAEYFVIFGDPNSERFRASLILKAAFPFELRL